MSELIPKGVSEPQGVGKILADTRAREKVNAQKTIDTDPRPVFCLTSSPGDDLSFTSWKSLPWFPTSEAATLYCLRLWVESGTMTASVQVDDVEVATIAVVSERNVTYVPDVVVSPEQAVRVLAVGSGARFIVQAWFRGRGGGHLHMYNNGGDG